MLDVGDDDQGVMCRSAPRQDRPAEARGLPVTDGRVE